MKYRGAGGNAKADHVRIAEKVLGRPLPPRAQIHHVNGSGLDNQNRNLVICEDLAYHKLLHVRTLVVRAGGSPDTQKLCSACKLAKDFGEFYEMRGSAVNPAARFSHACRPCSRRIALEQQRAKREETHA